MQQVNNIFIISILEIAARKYKCPKSSNAKKGLTALVFLGNEMGMIRTQGKRSTTENWKGKT